MMTVLNQRNTMEFNLLMKKRGETKRLSMKVFKQLGMLSKKATSQVAWEASLIVRKASKNKILRGEKN